MTALEVQATTREFVEAIFEGTADLRVRIAVKEDPRGFVFSYHVDSGDQPLVAANGTLPAGVTRGTLNNALAKSLRAVMDLQEKTGQGHVAARYYQPSDDVPREP